MAHEHGRKSEGCKAIFERLSEYLDEELDPAVCATMDEHMEGCAPCRAFLESLRRTITALHDTDSPQLPDELRQEVLDAYHKLRDGLTE